MGSQWIVVTLCGKKTALATINTAYSGLHQANNQTWLMHLKHESMAGVGEQPKKRESKNILFLMVNKYTGEHRCFISTTGSSSLPKSTLIYTCQPSDAECMAIS